MSDLLQIQNLSSGYNGKTVLHNISFSVSKGDVFSIIGQNGCGKSTLLKTIARIIRDNTGDIYFADMNLHKKNTWDLKKLGISWFVQGGMVFPTMKVSEHFELSLKEHSKIAAKAIVEECLYHFPILSTCMGKRGGNLSGGQRQMLSFAMLIAQQTNCWLLDEPTAGLSPAAVKEVVSFLQTVKIDRNVSMILVEHNYHAAFNLSDQVAVIKDGIMTDIFSREVFERENFIETNMFN